MATRKSLAAARTTRERRARIANKLRAKIRAASKVVEPQRALVLDIESSPIEAYVWGLWDQNVGLDFIKTEWTILSYAAKWLGDKKVIYDDTGGRGADSVRDDSLLMDAVWDLLNEADIVIAQNGKKFDTRKINARLIMHGILPPSPYKVVDTMLSARKHFAFTSQKLAWTSDHLTNAPKSEHKKFPGFELWTECLADNPAAWAEMKKYNIQDIISTEKVYLRLLPWITNHPNVSAGAGRCPNCSKGKLLVVGGRHTMPSGIAYDKLWCQLCGHWARGKRMLQDIDERRAMPKSII